jgi:hypothetical protein
LGFKKSPTEMRSFVFAPTSRGGANQGADSSHTPTCGVVKVVIFESEQTEGIMQNKGSKHEVPAALQVDADGKFYKQPSVTTVGGRNINECEKFIPLKRWRNVSTTPLATLELCYHSPEIINFLEILLQQSSAVSSTSSIRQSQSQLISSLPLPMRGVKRGIEEVVDLTDDNHPLPLTPHPPPLHAHHHINQSDGFEKDGVEIIIADKEATLLDMTGDEENPYECIVVLRRAEE